MNLFDEIDDPEDVRRRNVFYQELLKIQDRYIDWFKSRPGLYDDQEHDELNNHLRGGIDGNYAKVIGFRPDSDLPNYIRKAVTEAADRCFL